jgi:hypothetical protein
VAILIPAVDPMTGHRDQAPYEVVVLAFLGFAGIVKALHLDSPSIVNRVLADDAFLMAWCSMLVIGSALGLVGRFWRGRLITALGLEQSGLLFVTGGCVVYILSLTQAVNLQAALLPGSLFCGIAVANIWRVVQIAREIRAIGKLSRIIESGGEP